MVSSGNNLGFYFQFLPWFFTTGRKKKKNQSKEHAHSINYKKQCKNKSVEFLVFVQVSNGFCF